MNTVFYNTVYTVFCVQDTFAPQEFIKRTSSELTKFVKVSSAIKACWFSFMLISDTETKISK